MLRDEAFSHFEGRNVGVGDTFKVGRYTLHCEVRVELELSEVWWVGECCYFAEVGWLTIALLIGQPHLAQDFGSATCNLLFLSALFPELAILYVLMCAIDLFWETPRSS